MNPLYRTILVILLSGSWQSALASVPQKRSSTLTPPAVVTTLLNLLAEQAEQSKEAKTRVERAQLEQALKTTTADLDADGASEYLVKVALPAVCDVHGNCPQYVLQRVRGEYQAILQAAGQRLLALRTESNGYRDLVVEGYLSDTETYVWEYAWTGSAYERSLCKVKQNFAHGSSIVTEVSCDSDAAAETTEPVDLDSLASNVKNARRSAPAPLPVPEAVPETAPEKAPEKTPEKAEPAIPTPTPVPVPLPLPRGRFVLLNGAFPVSARGFRAFPFRLAPNGLSVLRGQISVQGPPGTDINFCVTDPRGYANYVNNRLFNAVFCSGRVQVRQFELVLPPGDYVFLLDNRSSLLANKTVLGLVEILQ